MMILKAFLVILGCDPYIHPTCVRDLLRDKEIRWAMVGVKCSRNVLLY